MSTNSKNNKFAQKYNQTETNKYAETFLNRVDNCIDNKLKSQLQLRSAVVKRVNTDGTVDVCFPPDNDNLFTRIQNQSVYELSVGDSVEIMLKGGSFNNCWIIAKHQSDKIKRIQMQEARINYVSGGGSSSSGGSGTGVYVDTTMLNEAIKTAVNDLRTEIMASVNDSLAEIEKELATKYSATNIPPYPVKSVDGKTGNVSTDAVTYTEQTLTDEQKAQAKKNLGL